MNSSIKYKIAAFIAFAALLTIFYYSFKGIIEIPRNLNIAGLSFNLYGFILGVAVVVVYELVGRELTEKEKNIIKPNLTLMIVSILVGARLWHAITDFHLYQNNLIGILYVWNGGLSIFGALLGLFIVAYAKIKKSKLSILDKLAIYIPVGQFIGRLGNFVNHELFGGPTNLPWKMFVPEIYRPEQFKNYEFFHPAFLYEMIGNGILFIILRFSPIYKQKGSGVIFYSYLIGYGIVRFVIDFFRLDYDALWVLSVGQIICLGMVVFGIFKLRMIKSS